MTDKIGKARKKKNRIWIFAFLLMIAVAVFLSLLYLRKLSWNHYFASQYTVHGADVSYYQGEIDWEILSKQIDFAFIKATEGSYHVDVRFEENRQKATESGLTFGAYHFFSFESSGRTQAENFIATVGKWDGMLRPVVDVEYYSTTEEIASTDEIQRNLQEMLMMLEEYYGCKPILYATQSSYFTLLQGKFRDYPLWIRNVYVKPLIPGRRWIFWQYEDSAELDGYYGEQDKIDLNVFYGSREDLEKYRIYERKE